MSIIHDAAIGGHVEVIIDLIEKYCIDPRCKTIVSS